jgi:hypothetical protein
MNDLVDILNGLARMKRLLVHYGNRRLAKLVDKIEQQAWAEVEPAKIEAANKQADLAEHIIRVAAKEKVKLLCCNKPELHKMKRGDKWWASICHYKVAGEEKSRVVFVGRDAKTKPGPVIINGKPTKRCK